MFYCDGQREGGKGVGEENGGRSGEGKGRALEVCTGGTDVSFDGSCKLVSNNENLSS